MLPDQWVSDVNAESVLHSLGGVAAAVQDRVGYSKPQGSTAMFDAVYMALNEIKKSKKQRGGAAVVTATATTASSSVAQAGGARKRGRPRKSSKKASKKRSKRKSRK